MTQRRRSPWTPTVHRRIGDIDLRATLRFQCLLPGDPCTRLGPTSYERATHTPDGPASIRVTWSVATDTAAAEAWGPGGQWLLDRIDGLLGIADDVSSFEVEHPTLRGVWSANQGVRMSRTGTVWHDLAWFILQQRVRFVDAAESWRLMVADLGEPAPGPVEVTLPPSATRVAGLSYDAFHRFGIERARAENLIRTAREVGRIGAGVDAPFAQSEPRLTSIRGVGPWTRAGVQALTWGDPDTVLVGDVGLPHSVCWFFARESWGSDERMIELLEPFRPDRYRVIQLVMASGVKVPRTRPSRYGQNRIHRR